MESWAYNFTSKNDFIVVAYLGILQNLIDQLFDKTVGDYIWL